MKDLCGYFKSSWSLAPVSSSPEWSSLGNLNLLEQRLNRINCPQGDPQGVWYDGNWCKLGEGTHVASISFQRPHRVRWTLHCNALWTLHCTALSTVNTALHCTEYNAVGISEEGGDKEGLGFLPTSPREEWGEGCHTRLMHPTHANLILNNPYQQHHSHTLVVGSSKSTRWASKWLNSIQCIWLYQNIVKIIY